MAKKEKKPFFKRKWVWALIILIALFAAIPTEKKDEPKESTPQEEETKAIAPENEAPDTDPDEKPEPQPEDEPKDNKGDSEEKEDVSIETLSDLIELVLAENFKDYEISSDGNTISVNLWQDGIALEAATIQANGGGADNEAWMNMKSGIGSMSDSICELIKTAGRDDVIFSLNVLNDQNKENTLLSMVNSSIIYDALA